MTKDTPPMGKGLTPDARVIAMLRLLDSAGGIAGASDYPDDLLRAFYDDRGRGNDTFNIAIDARLITVSHDSDSDTSIARITASGRAALGAQHDQG